MVSREHGRADAGDGGLAIHRAEALVEVVVGLAVIGIVASIAVAAARTTCDKARQRATVADMRTISRAIQDYVDRTGGPPGQAEGLVVLAEVVPVSDHWHHAYHYSRDTHGNYTVESFGKDGLDGPDISVASRFDFARDIVLANGQFVAAPE
jgi:type II secretory pathway pseudopilin PulG